MIRSYTMMKTGSTTGTVCHQRKRIKPAHGPTPEDHDPRKLPLGPDRRATMSIGRTRHFRSPGWEASCSDSADHTTTPWRAVAHPDLRYWIEAEAERLASHGHVP